MLLYIEFEIAQCVVYFLLKVHLYNFLFSRNSDIATRQKYVKFVESVKDSGGTVHIFSSMHVSGERE